MYSNHISRYWQAEFILGYSILFLLWGCGNNDILNDSRTSSDYSYYCSAVQYDRGGRYSYSLTTFDPSGTLGQVERAMEAAQRGTPIVAVIYKNTNNNSNNTSYNKNNSNRTSEYGIIMAAPQILPNIFTVDDGTTRFSLVTADIMISHSGLSSDGRILVAAAQKLAIQHEYTFDETIDVNILIEELSLLYQEYTMKVAARPFGATLIVAYIPKSSTTMEDRNNQPALFRIDPSGNVESLGPYTVVNGRNLAKTDLLPNLKKIFLDSGEIPIEECQHKVVESLRQAWIQQHHTKHSENNYSDHEIDHLDVTILSATLSRNGDNQGGMFLKETHMANPEQQPVNQQ